MVLPRGMLRIFLSRYRHRNIDSRIIYHCLLLQSSLLFVTTEKFVCYSFRATEKQAPAFIYIGHVASTELSEVEEGIFGEKKLESEVGCSGACSVRYCDLTVTSRSGPRCQLLSSLLLLHSTSLHYLPPVHCTEQTHYRSMPLLSSQPDLDGLPLTTDYRCLWLVRSYFSA
jgi:hypothetical protein